MTAPPDTPGVAADVGARRFDRIRRVATSTPGWLALCAAWIAVVAFADIALDRDGQSPVLLIGLLMGAPLLASLHLDVRRTAQVCVAAAAVGVALALNHHVPFGPDLISRFGVVGWACAFAIWGVRRRLTALALRDDLRLAARRSAFLAEATTMLVSSLDYQQTLDNVAHAAVPQLADWCAVDVIEGRELRRVAVAHCDSAMEQLAWEVYERYPASLDDAHGVAHIVRSGEGALVPQLSDEMLIAGAHDNEQLRISRELQLHSAMIVPIVVAGQVIGVLSFVNSKGSREFTAEDFTLAKDLAARSGRAIEHARLHRDRAHIARTLQASLLPPALPDIPQLDIAAGYRPVGEGTEVGGDFYDCLKVGPGQWLTVIGDVEGKGVEAATLTSLVHHSLRTIAMQERSPARMLERLNEVVLANSRSSRFCTLALARLSIRDCGGVDGVVALGGHLQPLLRRFDGTVTQIGVPGTLIGAVSDPSLTDAEFELGAGDRLLLFSDGLSEARSRGKMLSEDGLAELLAIREDPDARSTCAALEEAAVRFADGRPSDDVTTFCVRVPERAAVSVRLSASPDPSAASQLRHAAVTAVERRPDVPSDVVALLVTELVANAVVHGTRQRRSTDTVELTVRVEDASLRCDVVSRGDSFDAVAQHPGPEQTSGRGLLLVDRLASRWGAERRPGGKQAVWFELDLGTAAEEAATDEARASDPAGSGAIRRESAASRV